MKHTIKLHSICHKRAVQGSFVLVIALVLTVRSERGMAGVTLCAFGDKLIEVVAEVVVDRFGGRAFFGEGEDA